MLLLLGGIQKQISMSFLTISFHFEREMKKEKFKFLILFH